MIFKRLDHFILLLATAAIAAQLVLEYRVYKLQQEKQAMLGDIEHMLVEVDELAKREAMSGGASLSRDRSDEGR